MENQTQPKKTNWTPLIVLIVIIIILIIRDMNETPLDPCKCGEVGARAQMVGYDNLSEESKKIFKACESNYSSPAEAYEACVNKVINKRK